jgi:hypothetical protein
MAHTATRRRIAIPCDQPGCRHHAAYVSVQDGRLTIEIRARHNGVWHTTHVALDEATGALRESEAPRPHAAS